MKRKTYTRGLIFALVVALVVVYLMPASKQQDVTNGWQASTFNPAPGGTKALFLTLRQLHWPVERWRQPWRELDEAEKNGSVLVLTRQPLATYREISPQEQNYLLDWVKQGNHLLLLGEFWETKDGSRLLDALGITITEEYRKQNAYDRSAEFLGFRRNRSILATAPGQPTSMGRELQVAQCSILPDLPREFRPLWELPIGPVIATRSWGNGTITLSTTSSFLDNEFINQRDNLSFFLWLLQPKGHPTPHVLFDETRHGFLLNYPVQELVKLPAVRMTGGLILLGLLVFLISQRQRWGQIIPLRLQPARSTREFVRSMAKLYRRADLRNATVKYLFDQTHQLILKKLELPADTPHDVIAKRLAKLYPELPAWKKLAVRFDGDKFTHGLPPNSWLKASQQLIQIQHTVS